MFQTLLIFTLPNTCHFKNKVHIVFTFLNSDKERQGGVAEEEKGGGREKGEARRDRADSRVHLLHHQPGRTFHLGPFSSFSCPAMWNDQASDIGGHVCQSHHAR